MKNSDMYRAIIRPRPELVGEDILWGWDVTLTDKSDDKTYPFAGGAEYKTADEALASGGRTMVRWMNALAVVKDKEVSEINLDAEIPEPTPEAEPEATEPDAAADEENTDAPAADAPVASEGESK